MKNLHPYVDDVLNVLWYSVKMVALFFVPALLFIGSAVVATTIDTYYGVKSSRKKGVPYESKRMRKGFLSKCTMWTVLILATYLFDKVFINDMVKVYIPVDLVATRVITGAIVYNEVRSLDESWVTLKGYSFIEKFKKFIKSILSLKDKING